MASSDPLYFHTDEEKRWHFENKCEEDTPSIRFERIRRHISILNGEFFEFNPEIFEEMIRKGFIPHS